MTAAIVRPAKASDAPAVAELLGQLGYPASAEDVIGRLARLQELPSIVAFVAEIDGRVAGVITGHVLAALHSTPLIAWLTALVVDDDCRHTGVGRQLAAAVEDWARSRGAARISVTSGKQRDDAHAFYERIGYERTGVRLTKPLADTL